MKRHTHPIIPAALVLLSTASVGTPAVAATGDDPCECWFQGYDDAREWSWDARSTAEFYKICEGRGQLSRYEDGFKASNEKAERTCGPKD